MMAKPPRHQNPDRSSLEYIQKMENEVKQLNKISKEDIKRYTDINAIKKLHSRLIEAETYLKSDLTRRGVNRSVISEADATERLLQKIHVLVQTREKIRLTKRDG